MPRISLLRPQIGIRASRAVRGVTLSFTDHFLSPMAFLFDCPHCTQSFEAELDLCGSTCNCPSCGQLFLVPELDPEVKAELMKQEAVLLGEAAALKSKSTRAKRATGAKNSSKPKEEPDSSKLVEERGLVMEERLQFETRVQSAELALEAALRRLNEAELTKATLEALRGKLEAEFKLESTKALRQQDDFKTERQALVAQVEASKSALAAALQRAELGESLREEFALSKENLERSEKQLAQLKLEQAGAAQQRADLEKALAAEREKFGGQLSALQTALSVAVERANLAEETAKFGSEVPQLRGELERFTAQQTVLEKGFSQERASFETKLKEAALDLESLTKQLALAKSDTVNLQNELAAANTRADEAKAEVLALNVKLEEAIRSRLPSGTPESNTLEAELLERLTSREETIKKLSSQLEALSLYDRHSMSFPDESAAPKFFQRPLSIGMITLLLGLGIGWMSSRSADGPVGSGDAATLSSKEKPQSGGAPLVAKPVALSESPTPASPGVVSTTPPTLNSSTSAASPAPSSAAAAGNEAAPSNAANPSTAFSAGLPSHLPDSFLGIKFGTPLMDVTARGQWQETSGKRHRKAELLGAGVEAVLTPDDLDHLVMGSYVRVAARQPESLSPFLEWAVNVQDAVSALYGQPSRMHQITGASEAAEVVRKISSGEDFYEAIWERDGDDTAMVLSIRVFNERSVVFRLEYRSRELTQAALERQAAAAERTASELGKGPKEGAPANPGKEMVAEEKAPATATKPAASVSQ